MAAPGTAAEHGQAAQENGTAATAANLPGRLAPDCSFPATSAKFLWAHLVWAIWLAFAAAASHQYASVLQRMGVNWGSVVMILLGFSSALVGVFLVSAGGNAPTSTQIERGFFRLACVVPFVACLGWFYHPSTALLCADSPGKAAIVRQALPASPMLRDVIARNHGAVWETVDDGTLRMAFPGNYRYWDGTEYHFVYDPSGEAGRTGALIFGRRILSSDPCGGPWYWCRLNAKIDAL